MDQIRRFLPLTAFFCGLLQPLKAENLEWHGSVLMNYASRISGDQAGEPSSGDFLLGEERVQLKIQGRSPSTPSSFFTKVEAVHDDVINQTDLDVREAYLNHTAGALDLRVGRQILTWGVGDLLFINDVFPKDYVSLFSGRPLEYLKIGSSGFKASTYGKSLSLDFVAIPFFKPDQLPQSDRFFLYDPFSQVTTRVEEKPRHDLKNTELAVRLSRPLLGWDAVFYAYRGFIKTPSMQPDSLLAPTKIVLTYPKLSVYGASLQGNTWGGVLSFEAGYDDSRQDHSGTNGTIPNSQTKYLVGYQRSPWTDFTAGFQYYGELMSRYDRYTASLPAGFPRQDRLRQLVTLRLTQFLKYQTWKLSLFTFYSPTDEDYYAIPEAAYRVNDELSVTAGGNIFGGKKETTFFGQFDKNDNLYVNLRYDF